MRVMSWLFRRLPNSMFSLLNIRIGFFLALRQIRRASLWTTSLIIFVMVLTFLNLVVLSGILVGLIQGSINAWRYQYTGDVLVSVLDDKTYIENSPNLIALIQTLPQVAEISPRYRDGGSLEANYKTRIETEKPNVANGQVIGIDPTSEHSVTGLKNALMLGSYLTPTDYDSVVIGHYLLEQYFPLQDPSFPTLKNTTVGSKIRLSINGVTREVTVKGIVKSKVDFVSRAIFMPQAQMRSLIGRGDGNVDEVAIKLKPGANPGAVRDALIRAGVDDIAKVQTYEDAQPKFLKDIIKTFNTLGAVFSSIGLVVASITIFIVIFINALTRRKFIGILKGIGIDGRAIEYSYVFQSVFYAVIGSCIGLALVYGFLVPYIAQHPIDFPFSDGILVAPLGETFFRVGLLVFSTLVAGYIPAWMIVRKNTLDSILGRN